MGFFGSDGAAGPSFDSSGYVGDNFDSGGFGAGPSMGAADFGSTATGGGGGFGLSFGQGLGLSALSGLFSALGGILAAHEQGSQLKKLKQTPANSDQSIAEASRQKSLAPPTKYAPASPLSPQPMLGSPNAPQSSMAAQLQTKMQGLLSQVGSPQLKASRFGVGGF